MKSLLQILFIILIWVGGSANKTFCQVIFSDDFESGTAQWTLEGTWDTTTAQSVSPTNSLTESPGGNYAHNLNIAATMVNGVDLSSALGAEVRFWARYDIEVGLEFDNMYLEATKDGTNWIQIARFEGEGVPWTQYSYQLDGFLGNSDVKLRFRFYSDPGYTVDGMYIDDFEIETSAQDTVPPLIVHQGPELYEGSPTESVIIAQINDISGVESAELHFMVDSGSTQIISPSSIVGDTFTFTIPQQGHGSQIDYEIYATDSLSNTNLIVPSYSCISGDYIAYENPTISYLFAVTVGTGVAVRMTTPAVYDDLVYALIRNYTDINNPNDDFEFHVWSDNGGIPGTDLITPFIVTPEANLLVTSPMTRIDLRPYMSQLSDLAGDFFVGFMVPTGTCNITRFNPAQANRSFIWNGTSWNTTPYDYHFRVVMSNEGSLPVELTSFTARQVGGEIKLEWQTATEVENYGFEIQRKNEVGNWEIIGFVNGHGNSNAPKRYFYNDKDFTGSNFIYRLKQIDIDGMFEYSDEVEVNVLPSKIEVSQNFPNPFNPTTTIKYSLSEKVKVELKVYDILGNEIAILENGHKNAGVYKIQFNAGNLPSGVYVYQLRAGDIVETKRMLLIK